MNVYKLNIFDIYAQLEKELMCRKVVSNPDPSVLSGRVFILWVSHIKN